MPDSTIDAIPSTPPPATESRSEFLPIRDIRLHVRHWGDPKLPTLVLIMGWLDASATFQFLAEGLLDRFHVICPDSRGFGLSERNPHGYWIQDYVADLDAVVDHYMAESGESQIFLAGHSLGAQVASMFAGLRPQLIRKLVLLDGPFIPEQDPDQSPVRYLAWLDRLKKSPIDIRYNSVEDFAIRIAKLNPQFSPERALFVARSWTYEDTRDGVKGVWLRADPQHRLPWPILYRAAETLAMWRRITAPILSIDAGKSNARFISDAEVAERRTVFKDHRVVRFENAGHMLHLDLPEATAAAMCEFLCAE